MPSDPIDANTVRHVAKLAQLALTPDQVTALQGQLNAILASMQGLDRFDASALAPTLHAIELHAPLRADVVQSPMAPRDAWQAAPSMINGGFAVPKVMDGG